MEKLVYVVLWRDTARYARFTVNLETTSFRIGRTFTSFVRFDWAMGVRP